jgi:heme exporter protein A
MYNSARLALLPEYSGQAFFILRCRQPCQLLFSKPWRSLASAIEAIWQALAEVGLRGFEDVPCHTLSAGQQRRVGLARLYLSPPPLWILDEPFTALDKHGVAQLERHLAAHCEQGGLVVLTTHHSLTEKPAGYRELDLGQRAA